jgi:hypothetical protein
LVLQPARHHVSTDCCSNNDHKGVNPVGFKRLDVMLSGLIQCLHARLLLLLLLLLLLAWHMNCRPRVEVAARAASAANTWL